MPLRDSFSLVRYCDPEKIVVAFVPQTVVSRRKQQQELVVSYCKLLFELFRACSLLLLHIHPYQHRTYWSVPRLSSQTILSLLPLKKEQLERYVSKATVDFL